jgi:MFS family permease
VAGETVMTAGVMSIPIMTPFYLSLGLSQSQIALTQMLFTVAVMLLNIPLGWVADRFSRKLANVLGDTLCAISLLCYSQANNFWQIVGCEILLGVGAAFSQGVDSTLLKHFCDKEDSSGQFFRKKFARVQMFCQVETLVMMLLGGPIGAISFRLAIALSSIGYIAGTIMSIFVKDDSPRLANDHTGAFCQMKNIVFKNLKNPLIRWRILAYIFARECTHGIIWVFTPLMMLVGVPIEIVSVGWAINYLAATAGALIAGRMTRKLRDWQMFALPIAAICLSSSIMFCSLNIVTIWLYAIFGMTQGWVSASAMPIIKEHVASEEQATIESFARCLSQLLYIVSIWIINRAADFDTRYALLATVLVFLPLSIPAILKLRHESES